MKVNKIFCIDEELVDRLQEENNASALINELILNYYNATSSENIDVLKQKLREIKAILKQKSAEKRLFESKIAKIMCRNKEFLANFERNVGVKALEQLKKIENLDWDTANEICKKQNYVITPTKLIKLWREICDIRKKM